MNRNILSCAVYVMLCVLPAVRPAAAEDRKIVESDVYTLGEIVVSGETEGVQATQSVYTVTAADIRNKNARTLEQAINLLPGVNVRTGADGTPRIDVRGFRTRHVVLLLNGVPINSAFDQQFDPRTIPTENIAKIKLTAGASSVLYGQGGLGGVINIVTKKGAKGFKGMISGETGDREEYLGRASISAAKDKFDVFLSGSSQKITSFPLSEDFKSTSLQGPGYRKNSDRERDNVFANVGFNPTETLSLGLTFNYVQGKFGKPAGVIDPLLLDPFANNPRFDRVDDFHGISAQLAADYEVSRQLNIRGWAFANRLEEQENRYDNENLNSFNTNNSFRHHNTTIIQGVSLQPRYDFGKAGSLAMGLSAERDTFDQEGFDGRNPVSLDKALNIYSASLEYEFSPIEGLMLVAGYGHHWQIRSERKEDDFSINAGAYYDILRGTRIRASFNRNIRFPALGDLYGDQGNPDLSAERANTYQTGIDQQLPLDSTASITGFYTKARNFIQNDRTVNRNANIAEVDFHGFELAATSNFMKELLLRAAYTYLESKDKSRPGRDEFQNTPRDKVSLEAKYDFPFGFSPYASLQYVGNQYAYTRDAVAAVQKIKLKNFVLVNVKLSQRILDDTVNFFVGVDNIFDNNYETSYGFPREGRFIYGGLELRI